MKNRLTYFFALSFSVWGLSGCPESPNQTNPSATPSAVSPSLQASSEPNTTASNSPSGTRPTTTPSTIASSSPKPSSSASASSSPSNEPSDPPNSASPTTDISTASSTTFNGKVFDDTHAPLNDVTVKARSLSTSNPYSAQTTTAGGTYSFNDAPAGIQIEITASKSGFASRRRVEVLKSNVDGDPDANRYDFGNDGSNTSFSADHQALSDKPEVTQVSPSRNASGISPDTLIELTFSEPMDIATVEENLLIRSFTSETLSVDDQVTFLEYSSTGENKGSDIWDESAFDLTWQNSDAKLVLSFKEDRQLPTDKTSTNVPEYMLNFWNDDQQLKDKAGTTRSDDHFKLIDGNFEKYFKFSLLTDVSKPELDSITALSEEGGNAQGDAIKVVYSEPMVFHTLSKAIGGGINGTSSQAAAEISDGTDSVTGADAAANYQVTVAGGSTFTWPGTAVFDSADPTHKTVLLLSPTITDQTSTDRNDIYANNTVANTSSPTAISENGSNDADDTLTIHLLPSSGGAAQVLTADLGSATTAISTAVSVAARLQTLLNNAAAALGTPPSGNPFTVTGSDGSSDSISIRFVDATMTYAGWYIPSGGIPAETGIAFSFSTSNTTDLEADDSIKQGSFTTGQLVEVEASTTILDPAGNTVDANLNSASDTAS